MPITQDTPTQLLMNRPHLADMPEMTPLPDGYSVRLSRGEEDVSALARVMSAAFDEEWTEERVRNSLTNAPDVSAVYVVDWNGTSVATASSRHDSGRFPGSGYVHWVGALPDHAGRGLGVALMHRLLEDFRNRGYRDAMLETDDFRLPAIKVYLRLGFVPVYDVKTDDQRSRWSSVFQELFAPRE